MKPFIILSNGTKHFFDEEFEPNICEIAYSLSYINRFTGHIGEYSVAQHSVFVATKLPDELKMAGLLHDATEAYLGDVSAPLKSLLSEYRKIEDFHAKIIDSHFNVDTSHPLIKQEDMRALATEAVNFGITGLASEIEAQPYHEYINPLTPDEAYMAFMEMFIDLGGQI